MDANVHQTEEVCAAHCWSTATSIALCASARSVAECVECRGVLRHRSWAAREILGDPGYKVRLRPRAGTGGVRQQCPVSPVPAPEWRAGSACYRSGSRDQLPVQAGREGLAGVATTQMMDEAVVTDQRRGAVRVDLNADHLAVTETDAAGNYINAFSVLLVTYGKSQHQVEAIIGDAVASVVAYAREVGKPVVIEKLDFRQKKAVLEGESRRYSLMLSSFSYGEVKAYFLSRGYRQRV